MEKVAKTRKPHRKSRNGCLPCKARHVKCDEQKPECVNCDKYGSECEYPLPKKRKTPIHSPYSIVVSSPSTTDGIVINQTASEKNPIEVSQANLTLDIPQLRLLHHFTTVTAPTLAITPRAQDLLQVYLMKVAFDYPFLLHAVLALSALHLGRIERDSRDNYLLQAQRHHNAALVHFRANISDMDGTNFRAVLLFASTLFPYSCAISVDTGGDVEHAFESILSNLTLTRGVRPMVVGFYQAMKESELANLIPKEVMDIDWANEEPPIDTEITKLRKFSEVVHHLYPPDIIEAYGQAISCLEIVFAVAARLSTPPSDTLVKMWIHLVTPRFMELLSERQPGALIIFAHYAVLLERSQHYWFFEGVADQILSITSMLVPTEWRNWLEWPKEQIQGGNPQPT